MTKSELDKCKLKLIHFYAELKALDERKEQIRTQIKEMQERCNHPDLPKREIGEVYSDTCEYCGHNQYCYIF